MCLWRGIKFFIILFVISHIIFYSANAEEGITDLDYAWTDMVSYMDYDITTELPIVVKEASKYRKSQENSVTLSSLPSSKSSIDTKQTVDGKQKTTNQDNQSKKTDTISTNLADSKGTDQKQLLDNWTTEYVTGKIQKPIESIIRHQGRFVDLAYLLTTPDPTDKEAILNRQRKLNLPGASFWDVGNPEAVPLSTYEPIDYREEGNVLEDPSDWQYTTMKSELKDTNEQSTSTAIDSVTSSNKINAKAFNSTPNRRTTSFTTKENTIQLRSKQGDEHLFYEDKNTAAKTITPKINTNKTEHNGKDVKTVSRAGNNVTTKNTQSNNFRIEGKPKDSPVVDKTLTADITIKEDIISNAAITITDRAIMNAESVDKNVDAMYTKYDKNFGRSAGFKSEVRDIIEHANVEKTMYDTSDPSWEGMPTLDQFTTTKTTTTTTEPSTLFPTHTLRHPVVERAHEFMWKSYKGYLSAFFMALCENIVEKQGKVKKLAVGLEHVGIWYIQGGYLAALGQKTLQYIEDFIGMSNIMAEQEITELSMTAYNYFSNHSLMDNDTKAIVEELETWFSVNEGDNLLNTLESVADWPNKGKKHGTICKEIIDALMAPYIRKGDYSETRRKLLENAEKAVLERISRPRHPHTEPTKRAKSVIENVKFVRMGGDEFDVISNYDGISSGGDGTDSEKSKNDGLRHIGIDDFYSTAPNKIQKNIDLPKYKNVNNGIKNFMQIFPAVPNINKIYQKFLKDKNYIADTLSSAKKPKLVPVVRPQNKNMNYKKFKGKYEISTNLKNNITITMSQEYASVLNRDNSKKSNNKHRHKRIQNKNHPPFWNPKRYQENLRFYPTTKEESSDYYYETKNINTDLQPNSILDDLVNKIEADLKIISIEEINNIKNNLHARPQESKNINNTEKHVFRQKKENIGFDKPNYPVRFTITNSNNNRGKNIETFSFPKKELVQTEKNTGDYAIEGKDIDSLENALSNQIKHLKEGLNIKSTPNDKVSKRLRSFLRDNTTNDKNNKTLLTLRLNKKKQLPHSNNPALKTKTKSKVFLVTKSTTLDNYYDSDSKDVIFSNKNVNAKMKHYQTKESNYPQANTNHQIKPYRITHFDLRENNNVKFVKNQLFEEINNEKKETTTITKRSKDFLTINDSNEEYYDTQNEGTGFLERNLSNIIKNLKNELNKNNAEPHHTHRTTLLTEKETTIENSTIKNSNFVVDHNENYEIKEMEKAINKRWTTPRVKKITTTHNTLHSNFGTHNKNKKLKNIQKQSYAPDLIKSKLVNFVSKSEKDITYENEEVLKRFYENFRTQKENKMNVSKKIMVESSYSDEELDIKTKLDDALRHDEIQTHKNYRRMADQNKIYKNEVSKKKLLRYLSSEIDEEPILKNNIYRVFGSQFAKNSNKKMIKWNQK